MSHGLRTPLNAILGFSQLLELDGKKDFSPLQNKNILHIIKAGEHLLFLINEILDLSKVESGKLELLMEPVSVKQVLNETCSMIKPSADRKGITFVHPELEDSNLFIYGDFVRVKQVLTNILSNAIKFNKEHGQVELKVVSDQNNVQFVICDTGNGIPEDQQIKIFEPFHRMEIHHHKIEGTGIGLSITKRLVESMKGEISLDSRLNEGSSFAINFLKCNFPEKQGVPVKHDDKFPVTPSSSKKYSVLYIEDDSANTELVSKIMSLNPNISFLSASMAQQGIDLAVEHKPDLILMDIQMPEMDGITALKILQNMEETKFIPVIAVSANAMESDIQKTLEKGFNSYITKPIHIASFLEKIESVLKTSG